MKKHKKRIVAEPENLARAGLGSLALAVLVLGCLMFFGCTPKPRPAPPIADAMPALSKIINEEYAIPFDFDSAQPLVSPSLFTMAYDSIKIEGHADARGSDAYNDALSQRRANAVLSELRAAGFAGSITAEAFGKRNPLCCDMTEECHARNRRVVVKTKRELIK